MVFEYLMWIPVVLLYKKDLKLFEICRTQGYNTKVWVNTKSCVFTPFMSVIPQKGLLRIVLRVILLKFP